MVVRRNSRKPPGQTRRTMRRVEVGRSHPAGRSEKNFCEKNNEAKNSESREALRGLRTKVEGLETGRAMERGVVETKGSRSFRSAQIGWERPRYSD